MNISAIDVGSSEFGGDGESIRSAFIKINHNFTELVENKLPTGIPTSTLGNIGDEPGDYAVDGQHYYVCYGTYDGVSPIWSRIPVDTEWS